MANDNFNFGEGVSTGLTPMSSSIEPTNPSFRDLSTGSLTSQNVKVGTRSILLRAGDNLDFAIKNLPSTGGTIYLASGTHYLTTNITIPAGVKITGDSESGSVVNFGGKNIGLIVGGNDVSLDNITLTNSIGSAVSATGYDNMVVTNISVTSCNIGFNYDTVTQMTFENIVITTPTTIGFKFTACGGGMSNFAITSPGTYGIQLINCTAGIAISQWVITTSASGGIIISGSSSLSFINGAIISPTGIGIELSATNNGINIDNIVISGATSDAIKFTATTDRSWVRDCTIIGSGGYGINIATATCDDNHIIDNYYASNTSGNLNDLGVGTIVR